MRFTVAESLLKKYGEETQTTVQIFLALNITEQRINSQEKPYVNDEQNEILTMSKNEVMEKTDSLLEQHSWLRDLATHYLSIDDLKPYIDETVKKLAEKFP